MNDGFPSRTRESAGAILARLIGAATLAAGSMLYGNGGSTLATLPIGAANTVLTSSGTAPQWSTGLSLAAPTPTISLGVNGSVSGGIKLWSATNNAEGNIYADATYGVRIDTNSNARPIRLDGSQVQISSATNISNTTASTSTTTGALVVAGGVGVGGAMFIAGNINCASGFRGSGGGSDTFVVGTHTLLSDAATANGFALQLSAGFHLDFWGYLAGIGTRVGRFTNAGKLELTASTATRATLNVPHGTAPTSPVNGDIWTTTAGLYVRINGVTVGPLS